MIQDAITHLELTPGEDFHIAINCAGHEMFDYVSIHVGTGIDSRRHALLGEAG